MRTGKLERNNVVSHHTTQPPCYAVTLQREQITISGEELSRGLGLDHRHFRVFGHLVHPIVNKHLLNSSIYSSKAKLGQFIVLATISTARDGLRSIERGSRSKRGVLPSFTNDVWRGDIHPHLSESLHPAADLRIEPQSQIPGLTCSHL